MGRKKNPASDMDVAEKKSTPLAQRLDGLITDVNALKDYLGVSTQAINQYRLGLARPSLENLCKIADFYHVSTDYLLGRTDPDNSTADEKWSMVSDFTRLSNQAVYQIRKISDTVFNGKKALNALISHPKFYQFVSYLGTYLYGTWAEEFTGETEGHISSIRSINDDELFKRYIQPAMLSNMFEILTEMKKQIEEGSDE